MTCSISRWFRYGALAAVIAVIGIYASILYAVADVVGKATPLVAVVVGAILSATLLAPLLRPRYALVTTVSLLVAGLFVYLSAVPGSQLTWDIPVELFQDAMTILSGRSVLRLDAVDIWALTVAPGPTFLAWYLAIRDQYTAAVAVAGTMLGVFALTGDAGTSVTLVGVVSGTVAVGLGNIEHAVIDDQFTAGVRAQLETLVAVLATMIVLSASIGLVASGSSFADVVGGDPADDDLHEVGLAPSGNDESVEANLAHTSGELYVAGNISLSAEVRMTVQSNELTYWRTAVYDRYTSDGWIRTGQARPYEETLTAPSGESERIEQAVEARTVLDAMPAANRPIAVEGEQANRTLVLTQGTVEPNEVLTAGDNYTVVSRQPVADPETLRKANDSSERVADRYRQLPESTPDRVYERTDEIVDDQPTDYDKAVEIEGYLKETNGYSQNVERPDGDIADVFLFEMDEGYCTYFATTMVVMLRTQDIPARLAAGYTPGQEVSDEENRSTYIVRGVDAHVWVEVYFPGNGWVRFDPTPADPRRSAEQERIRTARSNNVPNVDTVDSQDKALNRTTSESNSTATPTPSNGMLSTSPSSSDGSIPLVPSDRSVGLGLVTLIGAVAASSRIGLIRRIRRVAGLYYQRRYDPETDVQRAWLRTENMLGRQYRERQQGETLRAYLNSLASEHEINPLARDVFQVYEQARYGDGISRSEAAAAVRCADTLTRQSLPVLGNQDR